MSKANLFMLMVLIGFLMPAQATTPDDIAIVAKECPGVEDAIVIVDSSHIGITIRPLSYATSEDLEETIAILIAGYGYLLDATPGYIGYLRIGLATRSSGQIVAIWEARPEGTRQHFDTESNSILLSYVDEVIAKGKYLQYSDRYGDATKSVTTEEGRLSASVGNWL